MAEMLERGNPADSRGKNPACDLVSLMRQSDIVQFMVRTRINEASQDPSIPVELDLRRNIIRKIASLLETRHLKEAHGNSSDRTIYSGQIPPTIGRSDSFAGSMTMCLMRLRSQV